MPRENPPFSVPKGHVFSNQKEFDAAYLIELEKLQEEFIKLSYWAQETGYKIAVVFEGRDAAGKGGIIKRITESLSPRFCKVVALPKPTERERTQWYFQRYVQHLPAAGEMVIFDRSWYNRAGVEKVMGFCSEEEYQLFLAQCPLFENMIIESGIKLIKYWISVSDREQEKRFKGRSKDPNKRWKLSPMDLESIVRWDDYSKAKDNMFRHTNTPTSPWNIVPSDNKKAARLNCMAHLLSQIPYEDVTPASIPLPARPAKQYVCVPEDQYLVIKLAYVPPLTKKTKDKKDKKDKKKDKDTNSKSSESFKDKAEKKYDDDDFDDDDDEDEPTLSQTYSEEPASMVEGAVKRLAADNSIDYLIRNDPALLEKLRLD